MHTPEFWTMLERIPSLLPFSAEKLANAFGIMLVKSGGNASFTFYEGRGIALPDGVVIDEIDLRIRQQQPHPGFLTLKLSGTCVLQQVVHERFPNMAMVEHPRGRSPNEEAAYSHETSWGRLGFGFAEFNRDCLRSVVFDPK